MTITTQQYQHLTEMGIKLWQPRASSNSAVEAKPQTFVVLNNDEFYSLTNKKLFSDILQSISLSVGEVLQQDDHLDVGLFNWYFLADTSETDKIFYEHNKLFTPSIKNIENSPDLKKQLWQIIQQEINS